MSTPATNPEISKAEFGKLQKLFAAISKFVSKQFLWILFVVLISIPLTIVFNFLVEHYASNQLKEVFKTLAGRYPTFSVIYILTALGVYFARLVVKAMQAQFNPKTQ